MLVAPSVQRDALPFQARGPQVKKPIAREQVGHVNTGTGVPRDELTWPTTNGRVMRLRSLHLEVDSR